MFEEPDGQTKSGNQSPFSYYQGGNQPGTEILEKNIDADETREIDSPLRITGVATNSTPQTLAQLRSQIDERMRNRVITRRVNRFEKTTTTVVATKLGSVIAEDAEDEEEEETENKSKRANSSKSFSTFENSTHKNMHILLVTMTTIPILPDELLQCQISKPRVKQTSWQSARHPVTVGQALRSLEFPLAEQKF